MSGIERRYCDVRCNGCGKESAILADSVAQARKKLRSGGWRLYKNKSVVYDKCPHCAPPQGAGWRITG